MPSYKKHIKFYLNRLVFDHLHYYLKEAPPVFKFDLDVFYSILNDLSNIKYDREKKNNNGFIPLYSMLLKQRYGNSYSLYIRYLLNHSIICKSAYYSKGMCTYFKITDSISYYNFLLSNYSNISNRYDDITYSFQNNSKYTIVSTNNKEIEPNTNMVKIQEIVVIKIDTKSRVGKKIISVYNKEKDNIKHYPYHIKMMAYYLKDNLEIDVEEAKTYTIRKLENDINIANGNQKLITEAHNSFNQRMQSVLQIGEKGASRKLRFSRGGNNKRIDTNLTNMASDLRPFIKGFKQLSYLDLCNSQPVLFNIMLQKYIGKANEKLLNEIGLYGELTLSGVWYEYLAKLYNVDREQAKLIWMEVAYSQNRFYKKTKTIIHRGAKKIFLKTFPEILKVIENEKKINHADFAVALQRIESKVFIDEICKELVAVGIIPYTMHDGLLVDKEKEKETYGIMSRVLETNLGKVPVIAINGIKQYPQTELNTK